MSVTKLTPNRPVRRAVPETIDGRPLVLELRDDRGQTVLTIRPKYRHVASAVRRVTLEEIVVYCDRPLLRTTAGNNG